MRIIIPISPLFSLLLLSAVCGNPDEKPSSQNQPTIENAEKGEPPQVAPFEKVGAAKFSKDGELLRPSGYRKWVFVGSPVTPHDMNHGKAAFPEFHNVYIDPDSYDEYVKTGKYRDGTVIIKELVSVGGKEASSGKGYFQGDFIGLEVLVKSAKYAQDEPGNWAFHSFTAPKDKPIIKVAKALPTASCSSCHATAKEDFVFSEYYPVLRAAKGKGDHPDR